MNRFKSQFTITPIGVVEQTITLQHPGRISYEATCWPARFPRDYETGGQLSGDSLRLAPGQEVEVVGREGITLLVVPVVK